MKVRLNKYISQCGVCSRRHADVLITSKKVIVNGRVVSKLGHTIVPNKDIVKVNGKKISQKQFAYYAFNKPKRILSTMSDPGGRPTVADFFKHIKGIFPVGRLDWDAEGLMVLTNDGDFANKISHPKWGVDKTYLVKISGKINRNHIDKLLKGVTIIGGKVKAKSVMKIVRGDKRNDWVKITISQGKNRQIKRMFEKINLDVLKIKRISIGKLSLKGLKKGHLKEISKTSIV